MARLHIHENAGVRKFEIIDDEIRIGRELDNNVRIADPSVSRHHATLTRTPKGFVVKDNGSVNGTTFKGEKIKEALLANGDHFSLGQVKITMDCSDSMEDSNPSSSDS
jgi:pSer/pThr/pTyr-binding forkhead associated (FHA) protein